MNMKKILISMLCLVSALWCGDNALHSQPITGNGFNCFAAQRSSTKSLTNSFAQRFCLYDINGKEYISLILRLKDNKEKTSEFLNKYDCFVGSKCGRIVTLRLNVNQLDKIAKEKNILEIETARKAAGQNLKEAVYDLGVDKIKQSEQLLMPYTGKDVIIGIADWGFDYTNPNFYDSLMTQYRVLGAWDQYRNQGPAPEGFSYGTVFTDKESLLNAGTDTANIYDTGYHASHVAGITGGGGAGTQYQGVAPQAEWLFLSWLVDEASYMDGCSWMRNVAKQKNKRLVINNSWGVYLFGYMDGSSMLDEFINTMSDEDSVVFVVSAGNNGGENFHIEINPANIEGDTARSEIEFNFPTPASKNYWGETITLQGVDNAKFASFIEVYNYKWEKLYESPVLKCDGSVVSEDFFIMPEGDSIIFRASSRFPSDNRPLVDWEIRQNRYKNNMNHVVLVVTDMEGTVHAWNLACLTTGVGNWGLSFKDSQTGYLKGNDSYGVSEPALAEKCIAVAAHMYRRDGFWMPQITGFSSRGPVLAPYTKPEISAPGYTITSSYNSFASTPSTSKIKVEFEGRTYTFDALSGTSMSAPMVSGAVALMMQANASLSAGQIKQIIISTAKTDDYTGACPNDTWGWGKLDAYSCVKQAEELLGLNDAKTEQMYVYPVPSEDYIYVNGLNNADGYTCKVTVTDMMQRQYDCRITNGNCVEIKNLNTGVYMLNIRYKNEVKRFKFIKK
ncbi:MAG: S8 family peptidase [Bacteroidales bacterium]|nr:S8 family peptidase [Bacteroidales bacterium]